MEIITLPRLRNAELQIVCESSLTICQPLTIIQEVREKVEKEFAPFKAGMLKVQASAGDKKNLDKERDRYVLGFFGNVKAEEYFPHEKKAAQNVVAELIKVVNKYGGKITRLPLNEETATIDNMIGEVDKLDLSSLSEANLLRWLPLIVNANNNFKVASNEYIEDSVETSDTQAATNLAPDLTDALEGMYTMLFAHIKITKDAELIRCYAQLKELIDSFR